MLFLCFKLSPLLSQLTRVLPCAREQNILFPFTYSTSLLHPIFSLWPFSSCWCSPKHARKTASSMKSWRRYEQTVIKQKYLGQFPAIGSACLDERWREREVHTNTSPIKPWLLPNRVVTSSRRKRSKHSAVISYIHLKHLWTSLSISRRACEFRKELAIYRWQK